MKTKRMNIVEKTFLFSWPVALVTTFFIYLFISGGYALSYALGVASSLLMQSLNYRMMKELYKNNPSKIKSRTIWMYIAKFIFFGIVLFVIYQNPEQNIYFALGGLLTFRIVLIPVGIIFADKGDDQDAL